MPQILGGGLSNLCASSDVLTAVLLRMSVFWNDTLLDPIIE